MNSFFSTCMHYGYFFVIFWRSLGLTIFWKFISSFPYSVMYIEQCFFEVNKYSWRRDFTKVCLINCVISKTHFKQNFPKAWNVTRHVCSVVNNFFFSENWVQIIGRTYDSFLPKRSKSFPLILLNVPQFVFLWA